MLSLSHVLCIVYHSWISSCNTNVTSFATTQSNLTTNTGFYTLEPTHSPTWMPTVYGEFPHIHDVQSYIECGKNIQLKDTMYSDGYAGFMMNETIGIISVIFIVCKASSSFHSSDDLYVWYSDEHNSTLWNSQTLSPVLHSMSSADCTAFDPIINITAIGTYFVGLYRYKGDDYGQYSLYMECDTRYNSYIYPIATLPSYYALYNEYIPPSFENIDDIIGSISCDIIISSGIITQGDWHQASNKRHFYSFTVTKYTEWIHISTCDATEKPHTLTLYYINGNDDWGTISYDISTAVPCTYLQRDYLVPGTYYISIDITNLLYNEYTLAMVCSSNDSVTVVTDYNAYWRPTPTPKPTSVLIYTTISIRNVNVESRYATVGWTIAFILVGISLVVGTYLGYIKYKKRNRPNSKSKDKERDVEMSARATYDGVLSNEELKRSSDSSCSDSSSHEMDESKEVEVKNDHVAAAAIEGAMEVQEGAAAEGEVFIKRDVDDEVEHEDDNDVAPPAFANLDYAAIPPIAEGVAVAIADYDEKEEILPDEQYEFQVGSYCYVDCDTVYGLITGKLQHGYYMIIDLFEKRKRKANIKTLSLIQNMKDLEKAIKQHERYKKRERRKSSGQKHPS